MKKSIRAVALFGLLVAAAPLWAQGCKKDAKRSSHSGRKPQSKAGNSNMAATKQPNFIVFIDGNTGKETRRVPAAQVPQSIRFVRVNNRLVPVAKIVAITAGDHREIKQYGSRGELLQSTLQVRPPTK